MGTTTGEAKFVAGAAADDIADIADADVDVVGAADAAAATTK